MIPLAIVHNLALLLASVVLFDILTFRFSTAPMLMRKIFIGLLLGGVGIALMHTSWEIVPGIVLDARSVLLAISGLFFGFVVTVPLVLMTAAFRWYQGGAGATTGIFVIVATSGIGLLWRLFRRERLGRLSSIEIYLMGVVVHIVMLLVILSLPGEVGVSVVSAMSIPVMLLFPLVTLLTGVLLVARARREREAREVVESNQMLNMVLQTVPQAIFWKDTKGVYRGCNAVFARYAGLESPEQVVGKTDFDLLLVQEVAEGYRAVDQQVLATNTPQRHVVESVQQADGTLVWTDTSKSPLFDAQGVQFGLLGVYEDITEQWTAEEERKSLLEQLHQAQKMDAVGQLAGGVAHDFNNMLGVIIGRIEMLLFQIEEDHPFYGTLSEVIGAAQRSADLTRQLLAFARKQTVAPKVTEINAAVEGMLKIVRRLIGEHIELCWLPSAQLPLVFMDPSQIDQILANLCVNARDAIDGHGRITLQSDVVELDDAFCATHLGIQPGNYVVLSVSDTGCGMDSDRMARVFEPFFSTKDVGKGCGLGLPTVYGIVLQNRGTIEVKSIPGQGTTFSIYLPVHASNENVAITTAAVADRAAVNTPVSILLVEDEPMVLESIELILSGHGHRVFAASTIQQALDLAASENSLDLLLTDVIMPDMNGKELAEQIVVKIPSIKVLYMSGYPESVIAQRGVLEEGINFIQKPFKMLDLLAAIDKLFSTAP